MPPSMHLHGRPRSRRGAQHSVGGAPRARMPAYRCARGGLASYIRIRAKTAKCLCGPGFGVCGNTKPAHDVTRAAGGLP